MGDSATAPVLACSKVASSNACLHSWLRLAVDSGCAYASVPADADAKATAANRGSRDKGSTPGENDFPAAASARVGHRDDRSFACGRARCGSRPHLRSTVRCPTPPVAARTNGHSRWLLYPRGPEHVAIAIRDRTSLPLHRCDLTAARRIRLFPDSKKQFAESSGDNLLL